MMPEFDAKKDAEIIQEQPEMTDKGSEAGIAGLFSLKRLPPAGVGGFRAHFWRPFGTLWAHFGGLLA